MTMATRAKLPADKWFWLVVHNNPNGHLNFRAFTAHAPAIAWWSELAATDFANQIAADFDEERVHVLDARIYKG